MDKDGVFLLLNVAVKVLS